MNHSLLDSKDIAAHFGTENSETAKQLPDEIIDSHDEATDRNLIAEAEKKAK
jgi:hypothetical protein